MPQSRGEARHRRVNTRQSQSGSSGRSHGALRASEERYTLLNVTADGERKANGELHAMLRGRIEILEAERIAAVAERDHGVSRALEAERVMRESYEQFAVLERERDALRETVADMNEQCAPVSQRAPDKSKSPLRASSES